MSSGPVVRVVLTERLQVRNGGLLHPGESVGLRPDEAEDLVRRGGAAYASPEGAPADDLTELVQRAPGSPRANKMVSGSKSVKK